MAAGQVVNLGHLRIRVLSSRVVILLRGSNSKMRCKIESSSGESGSIDLRNFGLLM